MAPGDVQYFVAYIVGLVGDLVNLIGVAITTFGSHMIAAAGDTGKMWALTVGIFGENGGLIYWINEKSLSDVEWILNISFVP